MSIQTQAPVQSVKYSSPSLDAPSSKGRVLLVDDEALVLHAYERMMRLSGYETETATDGAIAAQMVESRDYDLIISDITMPGMTGLQLLESLRRANPDIPVIIATGDPTLETAVKALEHGAFRYLIKPIDIDVLQKAAEEGVRLRHLARLKRHAFELYFNTPQNTAQADLEVTFNRGLENVWMAFQPIVSWSEKRIFGYEALVRTREPSLMPPDEFLRVAEQLNRLHKLGRIIRERVVAAVSQHVDLVLLVNLHPKDLDDPSLFDLSAPLSALASRVFLEITERASLDGANQTRTKVAALRKIGYRVALDDLGAGYAGLTSFTHLEPELVKLDMALVRDIHKEPTKQKLIRSMSALCRELGILVVCEGVETVAERDCLLDLGCDLLQGFLFAKPAPRFPPVSW